MVEFLIEGSPTLGDCSEVIGDTIGAPIAWVESAELAPAFGVWGSFQQLPGGEFRAHVLIVRIPPASILSEEKFYESVARCLNTGVLVSHQTVNPYLMRLVKDGAWSNVALANESLDEHGTFVIEDPDSGASA